MSDPTPWIVVVTGETPSNVSRIRCRRCGDMHDTQLPMGVSEWVRMQQAFGKRHRKCVEVSGG